MDSRSRSLSYHAALSIPELEQRERRRYFRSVLAVIGTTVLCLLLFVLIGSNGVLVAFLGIGGTIVVASLSAWLWRHPLRGLYVLFGAAVAIDVNYTETTANGYFIAHYIPLWQDFTAWTHVHIIVSLAELFMALLLIIWLLKSIAQRSWRFDKGSLMLPLGLYMLMVFIGEFHGVTSGGNLTKSLWEMRSQIYMLVAYVLTCNLVRTRTAIHTILWILILGAGFRAIEGTFRYFIYFRGRTLQEVDVFPHEQAFFFNAFLTLTAILFLYGGPPRMKRVALWLLPFVLFVDVAVQRRAAILAIGFGLLLLLMATWIAQPDRRRVIGGVILILALGFPPYYLKFQGSSGSFAAPAHAIASSFRPTARDAGSNQYRITEDADIMATMKSSTASAIIGYGYGKPMLTPYPLPDISKIYIWWNYMPHNSILWVWMRLGTVGYVLLWFLIGAAVVQGMQLMRRLKDPVLQGLTLFIVLMVLQEVVFGYLDLQWTNYRNLITVGLLFALISRLDALAAAERSLETNDPTSNVEGRKRVNVSVPSSLVVINGRLKLLDR